MRLIRILSYTLVPMLPTLITLATGFSVGNGTEYGFPLSWRTWGFYCVRSVFGVCLSNVSAWLDFFLDTTFYAAILCTCFQAREEFKRSALSLYRSLGRLSPSWKELSTPFQVSAIMGVLASAYVAYSILPRLFIEWITLSPLPSTGGATGTHAFTLIVIVFLILIAIPLGGAIGLVTLKLSDERRGIVALFVTVFSFIPDLYLGFQVLGWLIAFSEYLVVALFWAILLFMSARMVQSRKNNEGRL